MTDEELKRFGFARPAGDLTSNPPPTNEQVEQLYMADKTDAAVDRPSINVSVDSSIPPIDPMVAVQIEMDRAKMERVMAEAMSRAAGGIKHDSDKLPMTLLDRHALEEIARVLKFGAEKYAPHNWRKGIEMSRLLDAGMRHLLAYADGESLDEETQISHLAHLGCCIMFALWMEKNRPDLDDRWRKS